MLLAFATFCRLESYRLEFDQFAPVVEECTMRPMFPKNSSVWPRDSMLEYDDWFLDGNRRELLPQGFAIFFDDGGHETCFNEFLRRRAPVAAIGIVHEGAHAVVTPADDEFQVILNDGKVSFA